MRTGRKYDLDEFARRGDAIYDRTIRPVLKDGDRGKFVAIDIETGEYEISRNSLTATKKLYARLPEAQPWMVRVGYSYVRRLGHLKRDEQS